MTKSDNASTLYARAGSFSKNLKGRNMSKTCRLLSHVSSHESFVHQNWCADVRVYLAASGIIETIRIPVHLSRKSDDSYHLITRGSADRPLGFCTVSARELVFKMAEAIRGAADSMTQLFGSESSYQIEITFAGDDSAQLRQNLVDEIVCPGSVPYGLYRDEV